MAQPVSSKQAAVDLIDPFNEPEPSAETGPGAHFGSTFAGVPSQATSSSSSSNNPFRKPSSPSSKGGVSETVRPVGTSSRGGVTETTRSVGRGSPPSKFPNYREEAFGGYTDRPNNSSANPPPAYDAVAGSSSNEPARRRGSSLKERYPGDHSHKPLDIIRKDSKKANRSHHLKKHSIQGPDMIDRLDPALGGHAYHHEGPYDAASLARNRDPKTAPVAALKTTNEEALKATPRENVRDALERHKPLDGVAVVPPGQPDQLGRTYDYEEGTDMMREGMNTEPGYNRWPGKEYDPEDLKGQAEPGFSLDRALKAHKIDDNGIEMKDHAHLNRDYHRAERDGLLDSRDPVTIAGDDRKYHELARTNDTDLQHDMNRGGSIKKRVGSIKRRIGSLRHKNGDE